MRFVTSLAVAAVLTLSLIATSAQASDTRQVKVVVLDSRSKTVNDLRPDDFVLEIDEVERPIALWIKAQNLFRRSVYTLRFEAERGAPKRWHSVAVRVRRPGLTVKYSRGLEY